MASPCSWGLVLGPQTKPSWTLGARGCFQLSLYFSALLQTWSLPFLSVLTLLVRKFPSIYRCSSRPGELSVGQCFVCCCTSTGAQLPLLPCTCSPGAPSETRNSHAGRGHKFIQSKPSLHHVTEQGSKRQGLFIIFLKWKPKEVTRCY